MANGIVDLDIVTQLCEVIDATEKMSVEIMEHLDIVLEKLDQLEYSKDLKNDLDGIKNNIFITIESMQGQDLNRQKIERVVNKLDPQNGKFAASAKHIDGDKDNDVVDDDELAALIASMGANN